MRMCCRNLTRVDIPTTLTHLVAVSFICTLNVCMISEFALNGTYVTEVDDKNWITCL